MGAATEGSQAGKENLGTASVAPTLAAGTGTEKAAAAITPAAAAASSSGAAADKENVRATKNFLGSSASLATTKPAGPSTITGGVTAAPPSCEKGGVAFPVATASATVTILAALQPANLNAPLEALAATAPLEKRSTATGTGIVQSQGLTLGPQKGAKEEGGTARQI